MVMNFTNDESFEDLEIEVLEKLGIFGEYKKALLFLLAIAVKITYKGIEIIKGLPELFWIGYGWKEEAAVKDCVKYGVMKLGIMLPFGCLFVSLGDWFSVMNYPIWAFNSTSVVRKGMSFHCISAFSLKIAKIWGLGLFTGASCGSRQTRQGKERLTSGLQYDTEQEARILIEGGEPVIFLCNMHETTGCGIPFLVALSLQIGNALTSIRVSVLEWARKGIQDAALLRFAIAIVIRREAHLFWLAEHLMYDLWESLRGLEPGELDNLSKENTALEIPLYLAQFWGRSVDPKALPFGRKSLGGTVPRAASKPRARELPSQIAKAWNHPR
ncbi:hypothetical protein SCHPADRAFT_889347 [Schizopora paradoxa]|uniref:Uncharacterized protein n=1 Tax=Schizopora paradoxa TaxID=27342 RepID=A0A0H2RXU2_9AGAM|nr:hypothetical protein SCHPADRAFT_889347 [Schizopora paradoxa]